MNIKSNLTEIFLSFTLYWVFVGLIYFIPQLKYGPLNYFLFIPAGAKLFAILVFRWRGAFGVALGIFTRLMFTDGSEPWTAWFIVALVSTLVLYLVVEWGLKYFDVDENLSNLNYYQIVAIATVSSVANGFVFAYCLDRLTNIYMQADVFHHGFVLAMANIAGNAIFVCGLVLLMQSKNALLYFGDRLKKIKNNS